MLRLWTLIILLFATGATAETARVATWNIGGFNAIPTAKLDRIVEALTILDADIVVLPELNPLSHAATIATKLSDGGSRCYKPEAPDQPKAKQEIGFVFKCHVQVTNPGLIIFSDLEKQGYRNGAVVNVKIRNFDFVLVGLHLKASRGAEPRGLRTEQAKFISAFLQGVLRGGEKDVLVIGDYNMIPGEDKANFDTMNASKSIRFASSESLAGQVSHIIDNTRGSLLDGFAFTNVDAAEYQNGSIEIVQMHERMGMTRSQFKARVSDHLPLVAVFNVDVDHD